MRWRWSEKTVLGLALSLCAALFVAGWLTREDLSNQPYLDIVGGGFMFNYRNADVYYGFTAQVKRPLASGSIIEASFEDPEGRPAHIVSERVSTMTDRYALRSPSIRGVEAGKPYHVAIKVYDRERKNLLWETERTYRSQISDTVVPDRPLTVGPGYHRNPEEMKALGGAPGD